MEFGNLQCIRCYGADMVEIEIWSKGYLDYGIRSSPFSGDLRLHASEIRLSEGRLISIKGLGPKLNYYSTSLQILGRHYEENFFGKIK